MSLPDVTTPKAAIVLASGSGAQNRDEEIMGLRPFKVLSDSLTAAGYAILRMDDRGTAGSQGDFASALMDDLISDTAAGLSYLDSCYAGVPKGILGHSQGGIAAIRLASSTPPDFIITLASPAWSGDSLIMSQSRALSTTMTGSWPGESLQRNILDIAKGPLPSNVASPMIYALIAKEVGEVAGLPQVQSQLTAQVAAVVAAPYREMLRYNPATDIRAVKIPWLALNGDSDLQVLPGNLETISGLNSSATTLLLPSHNHLFQKATTGLPQEYPTLGQSPSTETISSIIEWLDKNIN